MKSLVLAEHDNKALKASTLNTVNAASQLSGSVSLLVAGVDCQTVAQEANRIIGIDKVVQADNSAYAHHTAENMAALVVDLAGDYDAILAPASTWGKNIVPRIAALLDVGQVSEISAIENEDTFVRPIYAGNAFETVKSLDSKKLITVRTTAFDAAELGQEAVNIENCDIVHDKKLSEFIGQALTQSARPDLSSARVVISGGRGLQNGENFAMLDELADCLNAAIGASRAAVDAGYVPNDYQVGQTGKIVAPDLYIAIGISGAIQHLAGMKDSKVIVAINKDPDAPIFQIADYGLVGDLFEIVPKLTALLKERKL